MLSHSQKTWNWCHNLNLKSWAMLQGLCLNKGLRLGPSSIMLTKASREGNRFFLITPEKDLAFQNIWPCSYDQFWMHVHGG